MATGNFIVKNTFTPTNALQPNRATPLDLPSYADSRPTVVLEYTLKGGSLPLPGGVNSTVLYQLTIVNLDPTSYLRLTFLGGVATAQTFTMQLPPNGGTFATAIVIPAVDPDVKLSWDPASLILSSVDVNGEPAAEEGFAYVYMTCAPAA